MKPMVEDIRMKYRYLDIREESVKKNSLLFRHNGYHGGSRKFLT
jgi:aspartyl-tRNA synthetase